MKKNPFDVFNEWYGLVQNTDMKEPTAMTLSTVSKEGRPSSRVVLLKQVDGQGFYFFSNYESRKADQISQNQNVSLVFHWHEPFHRQVRIEGTAAKADRKVSETYFATRSRGSQVGAWSSPQSKEISGREDLEERVEAVKKRFLDQEIPCPEFWGGYIVSPVRMEFWQAGENRLHTRWRYLKSNDNLWHGSTVAP